MTEIQPYDNSLLQPYWHSAQPISSDPRWGNRTNVGYSPGSVGGVPAGLVQWTYQNRLYMQLYGNDIVAGAMVAPIFIMTLLTPLLLVSAAFCLWLAYGLSTAFFAVAPLSGTSGYVVAVVLSAGVWIIGIGFALYFTVGMWIAALTIHRRRNGPLSRYLGWTRFFG